MVGHIEFFRPGSYWDAYELSYQLYGPEHAGQRIHDRGRRATWSTTCSRRKKVNRLSLVIVPDNAPSRRIADKCGFQLEGTARGAFFNTGQQRTTSSSTPYSATTPAPGTRTDWTAVR